MESTFIRERNLMPERWVQVTFSTDNIVSKMFVFKVFCRHHIHEHVQERSLFTVTSVKPSLGRMKQ